MKIAITGSRGFIGKHLVEKLEKDSNIEILEFDKPKLDLFDSENLKNLFREADIVIHLAGSNRDSENELLSTNTLGTLKVLEALRKNARKTKLIFASSFQVYRPMGLLKKIKEDAELNPQSIYGISKKCAEDLIKFYAGEYGIKSIILRLSNVYGPRCRPNYNSAIATFCYKAVNKEVLEVHDEKACRDYIHVKDVVDAIITSFNLKVENYEIMNVCSGKLYSLRDIVEILKKEIDIKVNYGRGEDRKQVVGDNEKIANLLNFRPKIEFEDGLKETLAYYRNEN